MKLFDHVKGKGAEVIRIDGLFPIFMVGNTYRNDPHWAMSGMSFGWGNGYVGIPSWHPWYGMDYDNIPVRCHGGLTFGQLDEDENLWVIGFDTCHFNDNEQNCNQDYVKCQCLMIVDRCMNTKEAQRIVKLHKIKKIVND
jgi:hypothetical protein